MTFRVTDTTRLAAAQRNLQASKARLDELNQEGSTQRKLRVPSDDPSGTANLMRLQQQLTQNAQYARNADDGSAWLTSVDSALTAVTTSLTQLRDLTLQAASGTNNDQSSNAIAKQMQAIKEHLLSLANTKYLGRSIFAGGTDAATAFTADPVAGTYTFNGGLPPNDAAPAVLRRIGPDTSVRVDADGGAVFGTGADSMFALIDTITTTMAAGDSPSSSLTAIDGFIGTIQGIHATVGTNMQRLQHAEDALTTDKTTLLGQQSSIRDIDPAEVILQLQTQQVAYQTALAVTAKSIQTTLMDYLR